ncbi:gliding motility-associated protein GldE, partial [Flavobacteriaceae bacterium]|nr:gliding motility-associated protein GldE [Flavobacteriaceae bacterium]
MDPEPISLFFNVLEFETSVIIGVILLLVLLLFSALVSGAEVALFSLTPTDLNENSENYSKRLDIISKLLDSPKKLLATILVANNFINIAIVLLFAYLGNFIFEDISSLLIRFIVEVLLVTFLILFFGEILPKIYASRNRIKFVKFMAYPLRFLDIIISPLSLPMRRVTIAIQKTLGKQKSSLSVDQLSQALELASEDDTTKEEQKILQGIVSFGNTDTKQVMQPRIDIFALDESLKFSEIFPDIIKNGFSRIPVFKDNIDTIVGVLYAKDLLPHLSRKEFNWNSLLRAPFFVPENKKLDDLMVEFQEKKVHLAIVVDEYGGTSGIVSLEDVIEEIVGDISDEFDDDD